MVKEVDISKINLNGCGQSVKKEIEAIRDSYLEGGEETRELCPEKKESNFFKYLFFFKKLSLKNNKAS